MAKTLVTVVCCLCCLNAFGASQRMAIPPISFELGPAGEEFIGAICLNLAREAPAVGRSLANILTGGEKATVSFADGRKMLLTEAIEQKLIEVQGTDDLALNFVNKTEIQASVDFSEAVVLSEEKESVADFANLGELLAEAGDSNPQQIVWEREELLRIQNGTTKIEDAKAIQAVESSQPGAKFVVEDLDGMQVHKFNKNKLETQPFQFARNPDGSLDPLSRSFAETTDVRTVRLLQEVASELHPEKSEFVYLGWLPGQGADVRLTVGKTSSNIGGTELRQLLSGGNVGKSLKDKFPPGRTFIIRRSEAEILEVPGALADATGSQAGYLRSVDLVQALQKAFPESSFALDDFPDVGMSHAEELARADGDHSLAILDDTISLSEQDREVFTPVLSDLRQAGISVVNSSSTEAEIVESNVLIITGDKGEGIPELLQRHHEAGHFEDKVLVVFSCGQEGDVPLNSAMLNSWWGAPKGILFYNEKINPLAVQRVLVELSNELKAQQAEAPGGVNELVKKCVRRALEAPENEPIKAQLQQLMNSLLQLSSLVPEKGHYFFEVAVSG